MLLRHAVHTSASTPACAVLALLLATVGGCAGISAGYEGDEDCRAVATPVTDADAALQGYNETPAAMLNRAEKRLLGTLKFASGTQAPVEVSFAADRSSLQFLDPGHDSCARWLEADVAVSLNAGSVLAGTSGGRLFLRKPTQMRGKLVAFDKVETSIAMPTFDQPVVEGPFLVFDMLEDAPGRWRLDIQAAARVASKTMECGDKSDMCLGWPGGSTGMMIFSPFAEATVQVAP